MTVFRIMIGIKFWRKSWPAIVGAFLSGLGATEVVFVALEQLFNSSNICGKNIWSVGVVLSIVFAFWRNRPKTSYTCNLAGSDVPISIIIGDALKRKGDLALACNVTFDTTYYNDFVSRGSFQGLIQKKLWADDLATLDRLLCSELMDKEVVVKHTDRPASKGDEYLPGTVVKVSAGGERHVYWVAMGKSSRGGSAVTNVADWSSALQGLWSFLSSSGHKTTLVLPLLGSGHSGFNESRESVLKEILFSFVAYSQNKKIVEKLEVCVLPSDMESYKIDFESVCEYLRVICHNSRRMCGDGMACSTAIMDEPLVRTYHNK